MSRLKQHFQDIKPVSKKMTAAEKEWYRDFVLGFYGRQKPKLRKLCKDDAQYQEQLSELNYDTNTARKLTMEGGTQRSYISSDWVHSESVSLSFEDAIIDAIDAGISVDSVVSGHEKINMRNSRTADATSYENDEGDAE